jgi:redox-sensitive bicupin YhaK (pirin superfamily)
VIEVRRAATRFLTRAEGITTYHSFSFGGHYDPDNVGFGALVAHNDEHVGTGAGYDWHSHREVEIVTWVVEGVLRHEDSLGNSEDVAAGCVTVTHAGKGVRHAETNASRSQPLRFVQSWLRGVPGTVTTDRPSFEVSDTRAALSGGGLVPVASGLPEVEAGCRLRLPATLWLARIARGERVDLPIRSRLHAFVIRGGLSPVLPGSGASAESGEATSVESIDDVPAWPGELLEGDALLIEEAAGVSVALRATRDTELMLWSMPSHDLSDPHPAIGG